MSNIERLRINAAGRFAAPVMELSETARTLAFRAVQTVIQSNGFLAQPGADMLVSLRRELRLEESSGLAGELTPEELRRADLGPAGADYLCYMTLLAGYADGRVSESERRVINGFCDALQIAPARRVEIEGACLQAILEANILMNLPDVIASSELAQRFCQELGLGPEILEHVAASILESLAEG